MFLSIGLIVLHRHDHHQESHSCHTETKHDHQHPNSEDCHYCFLFFQQGIQNVHGFSWESKPVEFLIAAVLNHSKIEFPSLNPQTGKSLRAPPLSYII